jgi:precorrin-6B C5,15-methyltransferase / cobalt-precorrin-6B C5,C15-methyltransferase
MSPMMTEETALSRLLVVGLSAGGAGSLPAALLERIAAADLLAGGQRHLSYFPDFHGERLTIGANIEAVVERLQQALALRQQGVVLASGDPLCYGIGASLRRYFPAENLEIIPAPSAFQLAFAALAEPWHEAALLSAHARPLAEVVTGVLAAPKAAILTDNHHTPATIAGALLEAGLLPGSPCAICENLGGPTQRIVRTCLAEVERQAYAPLNVLVIWPQPAPAPPRSPGLPDEAFSTSARQLTKREIRLLSLAELALGPGQALWDIGAGSGSVGLEAARQQPTARVYAIEKRAEMAGHIRENLRRFPASNFHLTEGLAPAGLAAWPRPDAVFIGGSGGQLLEIIHLVHERLKPEGRLVINLTTLESLQTVREQLPAAQVIQVQINRGVPILEMLRFEALNPVFIVTWRKLA